MKRALVSLLVLHGLLHLMGFAKAFGPLSQGAGLGWLLACVLLLATAALLAASWRGWPVVGLAALALSQALLVSAWSDAKFGTVANLLLLVPIALGAFELRRGSFRSTYQREVARRLAPRAASARVTEEDLRVLPPPVQTWLRRAGVVGRPHVHDYRIKWTGKLRQGPRARWMRFTAWQHNFTDPPARYFRMEASRLGLPFEAFHRFADGQATMRVRAASLVTVADAKGEQMNQSETVTLFNDMCLLAPATLLDARVAWEQLDDHRVRGTFTHAGHTVSAELTFDRNGDLSDFVSPDRFLSRDGQTYRSFPWSTPVQGYRDFPSGRVVGRAEARWMEPTGSWAYGVFEAEELQYNLAEPAAAPPPVPAARRDRGPAHAPLLGLR